MKKHFITDFIICGFCGWCMECLWTGIDAIRKRKDKTLLYRTSVWMFPIYGMAACLNPICSKLKNRCTLVRGGVYAVLIFLAEYFFGIFLKRHGACPWDYSKAKYNYKGVIRLDYAPAWFLAGLFFEKVLTRE
ncbi:MAG: hypothetical protein GX288_04500 [Clostridiales bacterium]|nr:hypothetical protein [Clostridiales bacterium]